MCFVKINQLSELQIFDRSIEIERSVRYHVSISTIMTHSHNYTECVNWLISC